MPSSTDDRQTYIDVALFLELVVLLVPVAYSFLIT